MADSKISAMPAATAVADTDLVPVVQGGINKRAAASLLRGVSGATDLDGLSDVTLTAPATDQILKFNGSEWVNAAAPGGGGGTVTQVTGGAGLIGTINTSGSLAVGAGTGITVNLDDVAINRATVDTWYASAAQGALAATALQPGSVDLGFNAATRTITNTAGDSAVLPLVASGAAGLAPQSGGGTVNFLRADGTWAAPTGSITSVTGTAPISVSGTATRTVTISAATTSAAGSMSAADKAKLDGIATAATANPVAVDSNITGITGADRITNMISLTQAEYDAINTKDASTLYVITA